MKGTTKSLGKKDKFDKFYTKKNVVLTCLQEINDLDSYDLIIEPSAGSGAFVKALDGYNVLSFDIEPELDIIKKKDWFDVDLISIKNEHDKILIVGNPPYGTSGNEAMKFFNHGAKIADTIAFILPRSFMKISVQNRMDLNYKLDNEPGLLLPEESFELNGESYNVPSVFQVWRRTDTPRTKSALKKTTEYFEFTTPDNADLRIQRVGGRAGKASLDLNVAKSSNYFIKLSDKLPLTKEEFVSLVNELEYPSLDYTVGPRSLPKPELIESFEMKLKTLKENKKDMS